LLRATGTVRSNEFWQYLDSLRSLLGMRAVSLAKIFEWLDRFDRPVGIIETGCTRQADSWGGDGGSTILFDKYAQFHPGSAVYSVDIDSGAVTLCRSLVSNRVRLHTGDSVEFLANLADSRPADLPFVDLLYLDSYDVDFENEFPSAFHHMKELVAAAPMIHSETLVVVDDSPSSFTGFFALDGQLHLMGPARPGGKGKFVADYALHIGAERLFDGYQSGWIRMRSGRQADSASSSARMA
jgi:hypothetical protein